MTDEQQESDGDDNTTPVKLFTSDKSADTTNDNGEPPIEGLLRYLSRGVRPTKSRKA